MRNLASWAALLLGAAHSGAQAPISVDPAFVAPFDPDFGVESGGVADMAFLDDGNLLISGAFRYPGDLTWHNGCVLSTAGGVVSENFYGTDVGGGHIRGWNDQLYIGTYNQFIRRYEQDGTLDPGYVHGQGQINLLQGAEFVVQSDGGILQVGAISWPIWGGSIYGLMRFTNTGAVDTTYQHRLSNGNIYLLRPTGDGRYWCSGVLSEYDGQPVSRFFRIWPNGDLDTTFQSTITTGWASDVHTTPDGRLVLAGNFVVPGVQDTMYLVRLLPEGGLDTTFNNLLHLEYFDPDLYALAYGIRSIVPLDEAHLLIAGVFWTIDDDRRGALAVVDTAGNLDPVLANYYGCDSVSGGVNNDREYGGIGHAEILDDGHIYIGGEYTGFNDGTWYPEQRMLTRLRPLNVGVSETSTAEPIMEVFPNPGSERIIVRTKKMHPRTSVSILDAVGVAVSTASVSGVETVVDVAALPAGLYIIQLSAPGQNPARIKWIKQ